MTLTEIDTALHELRDQWIAERNDKKKRALYSQINTLLDKRLVAMGIPSVGENESAQARRPADGNQADG